jgi:hypothetical protein
VSVRAVVVPATPLLVPGAAGSARVLVEVRRMVDAALAELVSDAGSGALLVLAHGSGPDLGSRRRRPSLQAAGIPDAWVPAVRDWPDASRRPAGVAASVALVCLADALAARGDLARLADVVVREVPGEMFDVEDACHDVDQAAGVVVAGGGAPGSREDGPKALAPGVDRVLAQVTAERGWVPVVRRAAERHEHLPADYQVTLLLD